MSHPICPQGPRRFTFAVVADTHVNESEDGSTSPFQANRKSNARARYVMREIAALHPEAAFVVHLGDMVHPVPGLPLYGQAVGHFRQIASALPMPLHLVPGNHDIGDKVVDWMPADVVNERYVQTYLDAFGHDYYAVEHEGLRVVVLNAQLLNSGLAREAEQRDWLEALLRGAPAQRTFLFTHYPPYVLHPEEPGSYDNIDRPARDWLLALLEDAGVEALFAGHVHHFWYGRQGATELYLLPSTAFVRHDYTELYRTDPGAEFGRDDDGKFGYALVDVHEAGHAVRMVRTQGRTLGAEDSYRPRHRLPPLCGKTSNLLRVGVELRHPWAEVVDIPATGGVQEFGRKQARNDYPLLALWEMGARLLKVSTQDLMAPAVRARMAMLAEAGQRFLLTSLGVPRAEAQALLAAHPSLVQGVEVNLSSARLAESAEGLRALRSAAPGVALYWAKLRMQDDHFDGTHFSHFVSTGLLPQELAALPAVLDGAGVQGMFEGVVLRVERGEDPLALAPMLADFTRQSGLRVLASMKLADRSLARMRDDDAENLWLIARVFLAAALSDRVTWVFDTFMDVDRGYHPRTGFIDRRYNPRPALHAFATLGQVLAPAAALNVAAERQVHGTAVLPFQTEQGPGALLRDAAPEQAGAVARVLGLPRLVHLPSGLLLPADAPDLPPDVAMPQGPWLLSGPVP